MENIDLIFLFVIAAFIGYYMCKKERSNFEGFAAIDDARQAVREVYNADIDAIRNLSSVATKLQAGGLTVPGNLTIRDALNVNDITVTKNVQVNGGIVANNNIANGWITGHFGSGPKDRVVIGNLENQATVGAHNNALNAWTPLRLQGDSINMVPNNGIVNFPNGWRINTADGHFRIQHNGADKLVAHNAGHPVYAPNGMDVGTWRGTGGGTLNVSGNINGAAALTAAGNINTSGTITASGNINAAGGMSAGNNSGNVLRYGDHMAFNMPRANNGWWLSEYYEKARVREHRGAFSVWAPNKA